MTDHLHKLRRYVLAAGVSGLLMLGMAAMSYWQASATRDVAVELRRLADAATERGHCDCLVLP